MTHSDIDTLAMIAIGELQPDAAEQEHLAGCSACREQLSELAGTVSLVRSAKQEELIAPAPDVWSRIHSELGLGADAGVPRHTIEGEAPTVVPVGAAPVTGPVDSSAPPAPPPSSAPPVELRQRIRKGPRGRHGVERTRPGMPLAAAAGVVGLVAGVGAGIWWQAARSAESAGERIAGTVIAEARLEPFPDWPDARGTAVVEERADGGREVVVDVGAAATSGAPAAPLREVWLIKPDGTGVVSIGLLDGPTGAFAIPSDIDLAEYTSVDVSAEIDDGDPAHSGDSIVRGTLLDS